MLTRQHFFKKLRHNSCSFFSSVPGKNFGASLSASLHLVFSTAHSLQVNLSEQRFFANYSLLKFKMVPNKNSNPHTLDNFCFRRCDVTLCVSSNWRQCPKFGRSTQTSERFCVRPSSRLPPYSPLPLGRPDTQVKFIATWRLTTEMFAAKSPIACNLQKLWHQRVTKNCYLWMLIVF